MSKTLRKPQLLQINLNTWYENNNAKKELHEENKKLASSPYLVTHLTPFGKLLYYDVQNAKNNSNTH